MRFEFKLFLMSAAVVFGVVAVTNLAVDPFGEFGSPSVEGFNARKVLEFEHDRIARRVALARRHRDCLLLGSSRVAVGFDTRIPALHDCSSPYNAGLAGATMSELEEILNSASDPTPPRRVILALDLFMFNATRHPVSDNTRDALETGWRGWLGRGEVALSVDTLKASFQTAVGQRGEAPFAEDGALKDIVFGATFARMRDARALFLRGMEGYIEHNLPPPAYRFSYQDGARDSLQSLRRLLARRYREPGTETILMFSPAHAWQWHLLRTIGLEAQWLDFRRQTARIVLEEAALAGADPFPLYDFARYGAVQTADVPPLGQRDQRVVGYWDASHFDKTVGQRVMAGIVARDDRDIPGLGSRVYPDEMEAHLTSVTKEAAAWRESHSDDLSQIEALVGCYAAKPLAIRLGLPREPETLCRGFRIATR